MGTGQIILYTVCAVAGGLAGIIFSAICIFMMYRFLFKQRLTLSDLLHTLFAKKINIVRASGFTVISEKSTTVSSAAKTQVALIPVIKEQVAPSPMSEKQAASVLMLEEPPQPSPEFAKPLSEIPAIDELLGNAAPGLLNEFEHNYKIARDFSGDNLVPLLTHVWDTNQSALNTLPDKLKNELEQIYSTIKMANQLVWFANEFQRHSPGLHEQYMNLLSIVTQKLDKLTRQPVSRFEPVGEKILANQVC
jgi:hypothetical protein